MHCASCGFANPAGMEFCTECGARLQHSCPQCWFANALAAKFCGKCGSALTAQPKAKRGKGARAHPQARVPRLASSGQARQPPSSYTPHHLAERIRAEQSALEARGSTDGERKTITALFADL